jgi:hypothetical protein
VEIVCRGIKISTSEKHFYGGIFPDCYFSGGFARNGVGRSITIDYQNLGAGGRGLTFSRPDSLIQTDTARFGLAPKRAVVV